MFVFEIILVKSSLQLYVLLIYTLVDLVNR